MKTSNQYELGFGPEDEAKIRRDEVLRSATYIANLERRLTNAYNALLMEPISKDERLSRWQTAINSETRFARQHINESLRRLLRAGEIGHLVKESPTGAFWNLNPDTDNHDPVCKQMGNKFWPWYILAFTNPYNNHPNCGCFLTASDGGPHSPGPSQTNSTARSAEARFLRRGAKLVLSRGVGAAKPATHTFRTDLYRRKRWRTQDMQLGGHYAYVNGRTVFIPVKKPATDLRTPQRDLTQTKKTSLTTFQAAPKPVSRPIKTGGWTDDDTLRSAWEGTFADFEVTVTSIRRKESNVQISADIFNAQGEKVGEVERGWRSDNTVAHYNLRLAYDVQGQGFATEYNYHAEDVYRANGVTQIELSASNEVGGYAWARQGYDFKFVKAVQIMEYAQEKKPTRAFPSYNVIERYLDDDAIYEYETQIRSNPDMSAYELSNVGIDRPWTDSNGREMWYGKALMLGSSWIGVKKLYPEPAEEASRAMQSALMRRLSRVENARDVVLSLASDVHWRWTQLMLQRAVPFYLVDDASDYSLHHLDVEATTAEVVVFNQAVERAVAVAKKTLKTD